MEWGNEIAVNGVRPDWLRDDDSLDAQWTTSPGWYSLNTGDATKTVWYDLASKSALRAIRLPADHPYYTVQRYNEQHGTSFVYWPGGDAAPADWDGGLTLMNDGRIKAGHMWSNSGFDDIIGYTRRSEPTRDTVAVERRTAGEWVALIGPDKCCMEQDGVMRALTHLGLICEPTEAERIAAETGVPVETVQRVLDARS